MQLDGEPALAIPAACGACRWRPVLNGTACPVPPAPQAHRHPDEVHRTRRRKPFPFGRGREASLTCERKGNDG